jgi:hypothetical protein
MKLVQIRDVVLGVTEVAEEDFHRKCRKRSVLVAKWPFVAIAVRMGYTVQEIADFIGTYVDHTPVIYGQGAMLAIIEEDYATDNYSRRLLWVYYECIRAIAKRLAEIKEEAESIDFSEWDRMYGARARV